VKCLYREELVYKKIIFGLIIFIIVSTTGVACNCTSGDKKSKLPTIDLTIWGPLDSEEVFKPIIDNYILKTRDEVNLSIEYVKKDYAEYEEETLNALAAGTGPDIWVIKNDSVYKHADKLEPMPEGFFKKSDKDTRSDIKIYEDTFPLIAVEDNIVDSKVYGVPFSIDTLVVYYNQEHFSEARKYLYKEGRKEEAKLFNIHPNNWEEFLKISEILTQKNDAGKITRAGASLGTAKNVEHSTDILAALMIQNQTKMVSADRLTATFNLPVTKETGEPTYTGTQALNFYTSFANPNKENYMWNTSMPNSVDAFMQGKTSMMIHYGYVRKRLEQEAPTLKYKIGPFPQISVATQSSDFASYWTNAVTNNSQNPNEAWKFIKYIFNYKLNSYLSATKKPSSEKINNLLIPNTKERVKSGEDPLKYQTMTAKYWYRGKYPVKVANAFYQMLQDVIINKEPLQKAIDASASIVTELYKMSAKSSTGSSPSPSPTPTSNK